jgi:hypothetical protein
MELLLFLLVLPLAANDFDPTLDVFLVVGS